MNFNDLLKNKKTVNFILILLMGIIIVTAGSCFTGEEKEKPQSEPSVEIEKRLENILSTVKGAGKVSVFVLLEDYGSSDYAKDIKNSDTGNEAKTVIADEVPVVVKTQTPKIKGVIVTASGAADGEVRQKLKTAVETALGVMPHRVEVLEKE